MTKEERDERARIAMALDTMLAVAERELRCDETAEQDQAEQRRQMRQRRRRARRNGHPPIGWMLLQRAS